MPLKVIYLNKKQQPKKEERELYNLDLVVQKAYDKFIEEKGNIITFEKYRSIFIKQLQ